MEMVLNGLVLGLSFFGILAGVVLAFYLITAFVIEMFDWIGWDVDIEVIVPSMIVLFICMFFGVLASYQNSLNKTRTNVEAVR